MGCWLVAVGDTESVLRLAFGSCNVPRECQQLGELPVGAVEAAAVFLELTYIPEFWLIREDLLGLLGLRRGPISRGLAVWAWRARVQSPQTHVKSQRWWPTLIIPVLPEASWLVSLPRHFLCSCVTDSVCSPESHVVYYEKAFIQDWDFSATFSP